MSTPNQTKIIVIRETIWESLVIDGSTFGSAAALAAFGHWLGSPAAEWLGVICVCLGVWSRAAGKRRFLTIAEARDELDKLEAKAP